MTMVCKSKNMCRRICVYSVITLTGISSVCLLLIVMGGISVTNNARYDIIRAPVEDKLGNNKFEMKQQRNNDVQLAKETAPQTNSSNSISARVGGEKYTAVVQIDQRILTMIDEIERSDRSRNGKTNIARIKNYTCTGNPRLYNGVEDLLCMRPPKFLQNFKNPCWVSEEGKFRCLPYFQIIGVDKCGSTDLFDRVAKHPDVLKNSGILEKETMWWSWKRYGHWLKRRIKIEPFEKYIHYFDTSTRTIQPQPSAGLITGDGTPMDIWDMSGWVMIPQNKGLKEPQIITPHLLHHVNPGVKLIIILRDPVERLFSDYFFLKLGRMTVQGFHDEVVRSIKLLHACTRKYSLRACLYNRGLHLKLDARIHLGFYSLFLEDWLKVFPREQFHILRTEDYSIHTKQHLQHLFKFLGLRDLPDAVIDKFAKSKRKHVTKRKKTAGKMLPQTRAILERLFEKYNSRLAGVLKDERFLWKT